MKTTQTPVVVLRPLTIGTDQFFPSDDPAAPTQTTLAVVRDYKADDVIVAPTITGEAYDLLLRTMAVAPVKTEPAPPAPPAPPPPAAPPAASKK